MCVYIIHMYRIWTKKSHHIYFYGDNLECSGISNIGERMGVGGGERGRESSMQLGFRVVSPIQRTHQNDSNPLLSIQGVFSPCWQALEPSKPTQNKVNSRQFTRQEENLIETTLHNNKQSNSCISLSLVINSPSSLLVFFFFWQIDGSFDMLCNVSFMTNLIWNGSQ